MVGLLTKGGLVSDDTNLIRMSEDGSSWGMARIGQAGG